MLGRAGSSRISRGEIIKFKGGYCMREAYSWVFREERRIFGSLELACLAVAFEKGINKICA